MTRWSAVMSQTPCTRCGSPPAGPAARCRPSASIIDRDATRPLCAELKWLAAALGQARDTEVLLARLTADLAAIPPALVVGPVQARITAHFTAELAQARQTALRCARRAALSPPAR